MVPVLKGTNNRPHPPIYFSHEGNKALKTEHWKIVLAKADQKAGEPEKWELYDLEKDRAERHNLAERYPNRVQQMSEIWEKMDRQFRNDAK